jgi:hypothetical protein
MRRGGNATCSSPCKGGYPTLARFLPYEIREWSSLVVEKVSVLLSNQSVGLSLIEGLEKNWKIDWIEKRIIIEKTKL